MQGVLGVKPHVPRTKELESFKIRWKKKIQEEYPTNEISELNIFGLWAYDAASALAMAVEKLGAGNFSFQRPPFPRDSTSLENGQLHTSAFQIVNVIGEGERGVGFWTTENGIVRRSNTTSKANLRAIMWPGESTSVPKGWVTRDPITNKTRPTGYSIAIFDAVMATLPYAVLMKYVPLKIRDRKAAGNKMNCFKDMFRLMPFDHFVNSFGDSEETDLPGCRGQLLFNSIPIRYIVVVNMDGNVGHLNGPIEGDSGKPEGMKDDEWKKLDRKAVGFIRQWIDDSVFHHVSTENSAHGLWTKLESLYDRKTAVNKAFLFRKLVNSKYKEGTPIAEHLNEIKSIVNQLAAMKITFDDELQALLLLSSLPESWETLVVTVSNSTPDGVVTMSQVTSSLLNEETRRKSSGSSHSEALVIENRGRGRSKSKASHNRDKSRGRSSSISKKDVECYYCHKKGHMKRECRKLKFKEQNKEKNSEKKQNDTAVVTDGELMIIRDDVSVNLIGQETDWVIDSGASFHVTSRADFFTSYSQGDFGNVRMGNEDVSKIVGMGDICLETNTGCKLLLRDVRHVPDIRLNLISTGKLDDEGYNNNFSDGKWKLSKGSLVVAKGKKTCSLYTVQAKICKCVVNTLENDSSTDLWHRRLGHMSEKGLQVLSKKELLAGIKDQVLDVFKHFQAKVERETGRQLKCVRSDNGGEYIGPFDQYCTNHGIRHEKTVKKTPQQNGVAERMNRTILERVRCLLSHSKLPRSFWGEAMRTAVDLINLSPSVPLNGDVPEKVWTGKEVSYDHLRVFGCRAFVHIPKDERSKLDPKAKQCIFIGYGHEEFGYRLYDPVDKKVVRSRDVVFLEDQTIEDIDKLESAESSTNDLVDLDPLNPPVVHDIDEEVQTPHDDAAEDDVEPEIEGEQSPKSHYHRHR
ncbi:Retrovirus-related Pol polyprotein from transposon TNT 1-94 [Vitis vinifera]|uniref:Retrovirus-related Pol polyprotein from transposon TNT 1-94 n=1 Tax=Vitis vinifera TaxID=29760 RepID=A0A438BTH6_VITVI|nr:Retrovirus-related Pol polyprotein from transposon TNT 1-94 [Vitis vinifera]